MNRISYLYVYISIMSKWVCTYSFISNIYSNISSTIELLSVFDYYLFSFGGVKPKLIIHRIYIYIYICFRIRGSMSHTSTVKQWLACGACRPKVPGSKPGSTAGGCMKIGSLTQRVRTYKPSADHCIAQRMRPQIRSHRLQHTNLYV